MTFLDRIKETSTSTGTGTFTLGGAVLGYKVFTNGTYKYCIVNETESEWEVGEGTVASGVLTRTTIEASSNGGAAVSFSAGTKYVFNTVSATYVNSLVPYTGATANVNLGAYNITATNIIRAGGLATQFLKADGSVDSTTYMNRAVYDTDGNGVVDAAEKMQTIGRNSTGATLYKGTIVYISGSTGNRPNFVKAQANSEATSAGTFGVVVSDIANNSDGYVATIGTLADLDTRTTATNPFTSVTLADGDTIYLDPNTAGYVTNVKPSAPNHIVYVGKVVRTSPTLGTIVYRIQNGYELNEIHDVAISSVANNDVLVYESSSTLWKNKSIATVLGYTPADDSLVVHLAGAENITGVKTFQNAIKTTTGNNLLNTGGGNTVIGYTADPASSATYKLDVNGGVKMYGVHLIQSNVGGGNTFLTISNQAGTAIATLTNGGALQFSGTATFTNTIGFNGKIGGSSTGGIAIVPGGVPSSLNDSQIMLLVSAPLVDYTSTYGLNEQGIFLGGTYNGGQGPTRMILGPSRYYNAGGTATSQWNFTIQPASGQVTDGYGSNLILAGGQGRGTGTPGKFIVQTSTATTTGTTLQTLSNRLEVDGTGQLKLNGYTSTSVFTGTVAGLLGFDSSGNVITSAAGISGSGTAGQVTYWSGTSSVTGSSNLFWDNTNGRLGIGTSSPTQILDIRGSLNSSTGIDVTNSSSGNSARSLIRLYNNNGSLAQLSIFGGGTAASYANKTFFEASKDFVIGTDAAIASGGTSKFQIYLGGYNAATSPQFTVNYNGNLLLNTTTDGGQRLQVIGSMRVGTTAASAMYWDDTNNRLGIGTSSPGYTLDVNGNSRISGNTLINLNQNSPTSLIVSNTNNNASSQTFIRSTSSNGHTEIGKFSASSTAYKTISANSGYLLNGIIGDLAIINEVATGNINFAAGGSSTAHLTIASTGVSTFSNDINISRNSNNTAQIFISNTTAGTFAGVQIRMDANSSAGLSTIGKLSSSNNNTKIILANDAFFYNNTAGDIAFLNDFASGNIKFAAGASTTAHMTIKSNGRINMSSLPTSSAGLSAGDLWNNLGIVSIV